MGQKVELEFEGGGTLFDDLNKIGVGVKTLGETHRRVQADIKIDIDKTVQKSKELGQSFDGASKLVVALAKSSGKGFTSLVKNLSEVADVTALVGTGFTTASRANFEKVNAALRQIAKEQGVVVKGIDAEKQARIDAMVETKKMTAEEGKLLGEVTEVVDALQRVGQNNENLPEVFNEAGEKILSFRAQLRLAREEMLRLADPAVAGPLSDQYKEAAQRVAELKNRVDDANKSIAALNPENKAAAFTSLGRALSGGAQAAGGFFIAFSNGNQELQNAIFKFQSLIFAIQGAGAFFEDLKDAQNDLFLVLGITTKAQEESMLVAEEQAVAEELAAAASYADAEAKGVQAAANLDEAASATLDAGAKLEQAGATGASVAASEADAVAKVEQAAANVAGAAAAELGAVAMGEQAAATAADVVASEADVVAKGALTVATGTAAVATGGLTAAFNTLKTAIATNPLGAILVAVLAVIGAFIAFSDSNKKVIHTYQELLDVIGRREQFRNLRIELEQTGLLIKREIERAKILQDVAAGRRRDAALTEQEKRDDLVFDRQLAEERKAGLEKDKADRLAILEDLKKAAKESNVADEKAFKKSGALARFRTDDERKLADLAVKLDLESTATRKEVLEAFNRKKDELRQTDLQAQKELLGIEAELSKAGNDIDQEAIEKAKDLAKRRIALEEQTAERLRELAKEIADKIQNLELNRADPRERLAIERKVADEEIALLERNLQREIALVEIRKNVGIEAFEELTDAQKKARADAIIDAGGAALSVQQQDAINALRLATERKFGDALREVLQEEASARLDLLRDGNEKETQQFEFALEGRKDVLRKAKVDEREIEAFEDRERAAFRREAGVKAIDLDTTLNVDRIRAKERGAESEKEFERQKQLDILAIQIAGAEAQLALIPEDGTAATAARRAALAATIADFKAASEKLKSEVIPFDILDLFGVNEKDKDRVRQGLNDILASTKEIVAAAYAQQQAQISAQVSATDAIIADQQRRRDELQALLDAAEEDQRNGLANNSDALREQINLTRQVEAEALADKKRLQEESKRLAKQQIAIDAAVQVSALLAANARLLEKGALAGPPGIIAAIALGVAMIAQFLAFKAKVNAASQNTPTFRKGGKLDGPSHELGGVALLDRRTGYYYGEAEGGEHITNREASKRHDPLLEAINSNDIGRVHEQAARELLKAGRVVVDAKAMRKITAMSASAPVRNEDLMPVLIARVDAMTSELEAFRKQERDREIYIPPGATTKRSANRTTRSK